MQSHGRIFGNVILGYDAPNMYWNSSVCVADYNARGMYKQGHNGAAPTILQYSLSSDVTVISRNTIAYDALVREYWYAC